MSDDPDERPGSRELDTFEGRLHDLLAPETQSGRVAAIPRDNEPLDEPVEIGAFLIEERVAQGGMGEVFRGRHRDRDVSVAVKIIGHTDDEEARRRFHREVEAQAQLIHPGIVFLFEYGTIDRKIEIDSRGGFSAGQSYMAMELAEYGTVDDLMPIGTWQIARKILVETLDALAFAHARGVVHRDLKPDNLLVFDTGESDKADWRVKLADFGIAHALGQERAAATDELSQAIGTPQYMSPEQFRGHWRRYGPWTDLYALGYIAWRLVCGRPPFDVGSFRQLIEAHFDNDLPSLEPMFEVPETLERWIHRCVAPSPEQRYRRAVDALRELPGPLSVTTTSESDVGFESDEPGVRQTEVEPASTHLTSQTDADETCLQIPTVPHTLPDTEPREMISTADLPDADGGLVDHRATVPEDWRPQRTGTVSAPPIGAGLGLFGLREPPFVNREEECDRIWEALGEVVERQTMRVVFLDGEIGTGKSRLAERMATRAHEVGAVDVIDAVHTSGGGPKEGLRGALESALRCVKMERGELYDHLLETLPSVEGADDSWLESDARALTEYLRPTDDGTKGVDGPAYRFSTPGQKYGLLARILERLAARRPVFLWLDDLQWGGEALGFLEHVRDRPHEVPGLFVVATIRSDVVAERPDLRDRFEELRAEPWAKSLQLDPLSRDHQRQFLVDLLPLEDDLASDLARRTEGHPLFAMQLLGHWIEEGAIDAGSEGFRLAEERAFDVPEDIHELWLRRLDRLAEDLDAEPRDSVQRAIERAAVLGQDVAGEEWRAVCDQLGIARSDRIRDVLVERGLAEPADTGWAFAHGLLVDSLERLAKDAGRWREHNRRCAELLEELYPDRPKTTATRRADHWLAADEREKALGPLKEKREGLFESGDPWAARETLEKRRELFDSLEISEEDPRRIETDLRIVAAERVLGSPPASTLPIAEEARDRAEESGAVRLLAIACREIAARRREMGDFERARRMAKRATRHARSSDDVLELCRTLNELGSMHYFEGDFEKAKRYFTEAHEYAVDSGIWFHQLQSQINLAWVATSRGEEERAAELFEGCLEASREAGYREIEMRCFNGLGDLARFQGNSEDARSRYRSYERLGREIDHRKHLASAYLNLAQVELMAGRFEEAGEQLAEAERRCREVSLEEAYVHVFPLVRATRSAGSGEWSRVDAELSAYADGWPADAQVSVDHPWLLELAGDYAAEAGEDERAERIWRLARDLWDRLDNPRARDRVVDKLDG